MKFIKILKSTYSCILPSILIGSISFILVWILLQFLKPNHNNDNSNEDRRRAEEAMDTSEASMEVNEFVDINWIDIICNVGGTIPALNDVYLSITRSNAILMRSNATFKLRLGNVTTLTDSDCVFSMDDDEIITRISKKLTTDNFLVNVVTITINNNGRETRTKGFSVPGSRISFIDRNEISLPTYTLMHEIGHAWGLPHPFNIEGQAYGDLPKACATSSERVYQMATCPYNLRTCKDATEDEILNNVMDYLPEKCGRKFYFSPYQISILEKFKNRGVI